MYFKNKIILCSLLISPFISFSQEFLEEVTKTFPNGQPMFIDYLEMEDLKKVKTDIFNEDGEKIFSMGFDKESGLPDGDFFDLINKGYFNKGVLTCNNCMLVGANVPSVFTYNYNRQNTSIVKGDVVNGRFNGEIEKFGFYENTYRKVDWESTRRYVAAGAGIGFRDVKTYRTGVFKRSESEFITYNKKGEIDGTYNLSVRGFDIKLDVDSGYIKTYVVKDNKGVIIDSLDNNNKIWKINYKFIKNNGLIVFTDFSNISGPEEIGENYNPRFGNVYSYDFMIATNERDVNVIKDIEEVLKRQNRGLRPQDKTTKINPILPIGGYVSVYYEDGGLNTYIRERKFNSGGSPSILDSNGIFSIHNENQQNNYTSLYFDYTRDYSRSMYDRKESYRDSNVFTIVYNYLVNDDKGIFEKRLKSGDSEGYHGSLIEFRNILLLSPYKDYLKMDLSKKNWILDFFKKGEFNGWNSLEMSKFFSKTINISDYIKCTSDLFNSSGLKELYVWNYKSKKYDKVDFDKLISLSILRNEIDVKSSEKSELSDNTTSLNDSKNGTNLSEIATKYNNKNFQLISTSLKSENKKKYSWYLKKIVQSIPGCIKIHQGVFDNISSDIIHTKYFFEKKDDLEIYKKIIENDNSFEVVYQNNTELLIVSKQ